MFHKLTNTEVLTTAFLWCSITIFTLISGMIHTRATWEPYNVVHPHGLRWMLDPCSVKVLLTHNCNWKTTVWIRYSYSCVTMKYAVIQSKDLNFIRILWTCFWLRMSTSALICDNPMFKGGNMSYPIVETLEAGYTRQCGGYVILLKSPTSVLNFLHQGLDLQVINSRAR